MPKSRVEFWNNKFINNVKRDSMVKTELEKAGIKCLVVWECTIKRMKKSDDYKRDVLKSISSFFDSNDIYMEL